jgi:hypothetical protein
MQECVAFRQRPYRLVGLGHRAFNAATRVRIPLGTPNPIKHLQHFPQEESVVRFEPPRVCRKLYYLQDRVSGTPGAVHSALFGDLRKSHCSPVRSYIATLRQRLDGLVTYGLRQDYRK